MFNTPMAWDRLAAVVYVDATFLDAEIAVVVEFAADEASVVVIVADEFVAVVADGFVVA